MSRKTWLNVLRVGLSLLAVVLLLHIVGGADVLQTLLSADWRWLAGAWCLSVLGLVVRTFRWQALLRGLGLRVPFLRLLKLYLVGAFFNTFLLSGFGGDVIRVIELAQDAQRDAAVGTVVVDRMTGLLSLMVMGLLVLPFTQGLPVWLIWTFVLVTGVGVCGGFLVLQGKALRALTARLPGFLSLAGSGKLAQVYAAVTGCGWRAVGLALALSTAFNFINIAVYWMCGAAVGLEMGLDFYFIAVPLLSTALLLPISVGGLGVRDWVAQPLFGSVGAPGALVAGMTLLVTLVTAASGLVGGVLYFGDGMIGLFKRRPAE